MKIARQHLLKPSCGLPQTRLSHRVSAAMLCVCALLLSFSAPHRAAAQAKIRQLRIYSIDVEGGQATLLVAPSGASLLVDTGWPGNNGRDVERIQAAMKDAGVTRIDRLLITHFHHDHVGGAPELVKRVPVGEFLDHGKPGRLAGYARRLAAYLKAIEGKPRRIVHPGDTIQIPGLSIVVLTADGEHMPRFPASSPGPTLIAPPSASGGGPETENARSAGILLTFGKFRFLDLGDLTGAKEVALVCPNNPIPPIDLYLVDHHGMNLSNSPRLRRCDSSPRGHHEQRRAQGGHAGGMENRP